ncbi:thiamine pyrophosphate-binding protein [Nocardia concava]|uniref:thiamine pyrophosphate-binding protein n=1 Tax=Nocardia concava TaxID=257281 RepID=UPI00030F7206|nr:thiamine pyrophosphate-binding protein [Nocardia concava]
MKFSEVLLREIRRRGITRVFGVPGRENASILFNEVPEIEYITARVEFNAGIMADFSGRLTRKPQVCFSTMGPGATNMATAVASAKLNKSPLVFISAQLERGDIFYNETHQCVDQTAMMAPVTKWSYEMKSPEELPAVMDKAFRLAMQEPVGPVHIAIPTDLFKCDINAPVDIDTPLDCVITYEQSSPTREAVDDVHRVLSQSREALCLIGAEAVRTGQAEAVLEFCREWNIPYITAANAKGLEPFDSPLNFGSASCYMEGIIGYPALKDIFTSVDTLVCIGYEYVDDLLPKMWAYGETKTIINISASPTFAVHSKFNPDHELIGSVSGILAAMTERGVLRQQDRSMDMVKAAYRDTLADNSQHGGLLTPVQVIKAVNPYFQQDAIVVTDIGYYRHHAILFTEPTATSQFFSDTGLSSFGTGLPSAIAAQLAFPDRPVFLLCGDGGFHSGSCDLATLARYGLPVIVIVMDNSAFELIHLYQKRHNEKANSSIVELEKVDFVKLAEANGCRGVKVSSIDELNAVISDHDRTGPLVIEVPMRYGEYDEFNESF